MGMPKYAKQRDANERDIVSDLEAIGATVKRFDDWDIVVGWRGKNWIFEIKVPGKRKKLKKSQIELRDTWNGQYDIIESSQEAMQIMHAVNVL